MANLEQEVMAKETEDNNRIQYNFLKISINEKKRNN